MVKKWILKVFWGLPVFIGFGIEQLRRGLTFIVRLSLVPFLYHGNNINLIRPNSEVSTREALRRERLRP